MVHTLVALRAVDRVRDALAALEVREVPKARYPPAELADHVAGADALFVHSENDYAARVLDAAPDLRVLAKPGSGLDNVDLEAATERGVAVLHTPGMNAVAVAEFAVGAVVALARRVRPAADHLEAGGWRTPDWWGTELRGETVGLLGLGAAGGETARRLAGWDLELLGHDPYVDPDRADALGVELVDLDGLFERARVVSLHVRLTDETRGLVGADELSALGPDGYLVNTARGAVVDEDALLAALEAGDLAGAALDVLAEEPPSPDHPLLGRDDVLATPHLAGATTAAREGMLRTAAEGVVSWLEGEGPGDATLANPAVLE